MILSSHHVFFFLFIPAPPVSLSLLLVSFLPLMVYFSQLCISLHSMLSPLLLSLLPFFPASLSPSSSGPSLPFSSLSAGCQGSCFLITMSRINLRIWEQLFSSLLHEDLGFLQETKTGGAWSPGLGFPWTSLDLQLPSPARAWSCFALFWGRVARQPLLGFLQVREGVKRRACIRRPGQEGVPGGLPLHTWFPHLFCPPQGS